MSSRFETFRRRIVTIPAIYVGLFAVVVASPILLVAGLAVGIVRRNRWSLLRAFALISVYLVATATGLLIGFVIWILTGAFLGLGRERQMRWYVPLQRWWTGSLWWGVRRCFSLKIDIEQWPDEIGDGQVLLFLRHASILDTLLSAALVANPLRKHLVYVFKRELLWEPALDVAGSRLGGHFAKRDAGESEREVQALTSLAENLKPDEGVIMYPEGTRWTPAKHRRVLNRIAKSGDERLVELATDLRYTLPPRLGGPLALIDGAPNANVLFLAHTGFEGLEKPKDILGGAFVGRTIRIKGWTVAAADIPRDRDGQIAWLYENWHEIDAWLAGHALGPQAAALALDPTAN